MMHLFSDPKPHLADSALWTSILRDLLPESNIKGKAHLASMLHTLREQGTVIKNGKLVPLLDCWESEVEFQQMVRFLKPFAVELKKMIDSTSAPVALGNSVVESK